MINQMIALCISVFGGIVVFMTTFPLFNEILQAMNFDAGTMAIIGMIPMVLVVAFLYIVVMGITGNNESNYPEQSDGF